MSRAYLCVSIDTENEPGRAGLAVHKRIIGRLQPLFASFGAKPTYLLAREVMQDDQCAETLRSISTSCELGTHLEHLEGELGDETASLTSLTDAFIRTFQHQPVSYRGGRFGLGPRTIEILARLGYGVEAGVTPNVDQSAAPTQPYRPDPSDPTRVGSSTVLEVPITIRRRFWNALPILGRHLAPLWLRPSSTAGDALVRLCEDEIGDARRAAPGRPVVLHAVLRNADASEPSILERLSTLLAFTQRESIAVVGLGDVPEILGA